MLHIHLCSLASLGSIVAALSGCADLTAPETGTRVRADVLAAAYPGLLTADEIAALAAVPEDAEARTEAEAELLARLARLKARAAGMEGPVLDPDERTRLEAEVNPGI